MIGTDQGTIGITLAHIDSLAMFPTIEDLDFARKPLEAQLTQRFPFNAEHSILEAMFAADEYVTLAIARNLSQSMFLIQEVAKNEPFDDEAEQNKNLAVTQAFRSLTDLAKSELEAQLKESIGKWMDPLKGQELVVKCDAECNPPNVVTAGKMVAMVALKGEGFVLPFYFVFDQYTTVHAILQDGISKFMQRLASTRPALFDVVCDRTNNGDEDIANRILNLDITVHDPELADRLRKAGFKDKE